MTRILCESHGIGGIAHVCYHLHHCVVVSKETIAHQEVSDEFSESTNLCEECELKHRNLTGEKLEAFYDLVTAVCGQCFELWREGGSPQRAQPVNKA